MNRFPLALASLPDCTAELRLVLRQTGKVSWTAFSSLPALWPPAFQLSASGPRSARRAHGTCPYGGIQVVLKRFCVSSPNDFGDEKLIIDAIARSLDVLPLAVDGNFNDAMKQLHTA